MRNLMEDLIDYSLIKTGSFRKKLDYMDIRKVIEEVISIQQRQADAKSITLESEYVGFNEDWRVGHDPIIYHD